MCSRHSQSQMLHLPAAYKNVIKDYIKILKDGPMADISNIPPDYDKQNQPLRIFIRIIEKKVFFL